MANVYTTPSAAAAPSFKLSLVFPAVLAVIVPLASFATAAATAAATPAAATATAATALLE